MSKADYDVVPYIVWTQEDLDRFFQNLPGNRNVDAIIEASFDFDEAKKDGNSANDHPCGRHDAPARTDSTPESQSMTRRP